MREHENPASLFQAGAWSDGPSWHPPDPRDIRIPGMVVTGLAGRGGMGAVYSAIQTGLGRPVALKILPPELSLHAIQRERFIREARVLAALEHPHILRVFDFGETTSGALYLVMEWAPGGDLRRLTQGRRPSPAEVDNWVGQIAAGLDHAHQAGVVHRDLKPGNLLLDDRGQIKIGDFGLAASAGLPQVGSLTLTLSGTTLGTLDYMAPEQSRPGHIPTRAVDLFALGVITYELLTGHLPKGAFPPASSLAGVPKAVDAVLAQALAPEPANRPKSAGAYHLALHHSLRRHRSVPASVLPIAAVLLLTITLALAAGAWFFPLSPSKSKPTSAPALPAPSTKPPTEPIASAPSTSPVPSAGGHVEKKADTLSPSIPQPVPASPAQPVAAPSAESDVPSPATFPTAAAPAPLSSPPTPPALPPASSSSTSTPTLAPSSLPPTTLIPPTDPHVPAQPPDHSPRPLTAAPVWADLLPKINPSRDTRAGTWQSTASGLRSGEGRCILQLPIPSADRYELRVRFTRLSGRHSVTLFLPTPSGPANFELDAWDRGIGGLQNINGQDLRAHGDFFPARLRNGEENHLRIEVNGTRIRAYWNEQSVWQRSVEGENLSILSLWRTASPAWPGIGSWESPTLFHSIEYRTLP